MPLVLITIGIILIVVGWRGTQNDFFGLLKGDFTGPSNFLVTAFAIAVVYFVGYIKGLKDISNAFLALILLVILLTNGKKGFFQQLNSQIRGI